jgi:hypothetical protein
VFFIAKRHMGILKSSAVAAFEAYVAKPVLYSRTETGRAVRMVWDCDSGTGESSAA